MGLFNWLKKKKWKKELEKKEEEAKEVIEKAKSGMEALRKFGTGIILGRKRKSPKEIIESEKEKGVEHAYFKLPRGELVDISLQKEEGSVNPSQYLVNQLLDKANKKQYVQIHTHPGGRGETLSGVPSQEDFQHFLGLKNIKTMVIAQRDKKTGEVQGYVLLKKTKKTKSCTPKEASATVAKDLPEDLRTYSRSGKQMWTNLKQVLKKRHILMRHVPAKGYTLKKGFFGWARFGGRTIVKFVKKKKS